MFLVAIAVVLLSVLYLLYNSQDSAPRPREEGEAEEQASFASAVAPEPPRLPPPDRGPLAIFFGSQTGKAETLSKSLARAARCALCREVPACVRAPRTHARPCLLHQ
jgi:sulfite reductase alpha subunit-like flavoprotein